MMFTTFHVSLRLAGVLSDHDLAELGKYVVEAIKGHRYGSSAELPWEIEDAQVITWTGDTIPFAQIAQLKRDT